MYLIVLWRSWLLGSNEKQCRTKSYDMTKVETHFRERFQLVKLPLCVRKQKYKCDVFLHVLLKSIEAELTRFFLKCVNIKVGAVLPCVVMVTRSYVSCPVFEISLHYNGPALARTTVASRALKKMYTILLCWIEFLVILSYSGCDLWSNYLVIQYVFYSSYFIIRMLIWTIYDWQSLKVRATTRWKLSFLNCWNNCNIHRGLWLGRLCAIRVKYSITFAQSWLRCDYPILLY